MAPIRNRQRRPSAVQVSRRRSSLASFALFKNVALASTNSSPRGLTFAPNVTPSNFTEEGDDWEDLDEAPMETMTFPPSEPSDAPRKPAARRKKSEGHIPRPPNAFMLFRADFVKQKHVPGSIETTHSTLSKIIGTCWRALALEEKRVWEHRAKVAKAEHKTKYPHYRFRPVHTKGRKKAERAQPSAEEERRVDEVAHLLLEGKKGAELATAVLRLDRAPHHHHPHPYAAQAMQQGYRAHRRSSSLPPLFGQAPIAMPTLPAFFGGSASRPASPVHNIARAALGHRRASSAQPLAAQSWLGPAPTPFGSAARDESPPLPEADHSMFSTDFLQGNGFQQPPLAFSFNPSFNFSPIESIAPNELPPSHGGHSRTPSAQHAPFDPVSYYGHPVAPHHAGAGGSQPSTAYSGSPAPSELALPVYAPRPTHAGGPPPDFGGFAFAPAQDPVQQQEFTVPFAGYAFEGPAPCAADIEQQYYVPQQPQEGGYYGQGHQFHHQHQQDLGPQAYFPGAVDGGSFDVSQYINVHAEA